VSDQNENKSVADLSRRNFLGVSSTALATAALVGIAARAQEVQETRKQKKIFLQAIRDKKTSRY
jgi:hypothetical protein